MLGDAVVGGLDCGDLFGFLVGNLDVESFFEHHDYFDQVQRVGAEVFDEVRAWRNFFRPAINSCSIGNVLSVVLR